jgi:hypothetical protein
MVWNFVASFSSIVRLQHGSGRVVSGHTQLTTQNSQNFVCQAVGKSINQHKQNAAVAAIRKVVFDFGTLEPTLDLFRAAVFRCLGSMETDQG